MSVAYVSVAQPNHGQIDAGRDDAGWLLIMATVLMIAPLQWIDPFRLTTSSLIVPATVATLTLGVAAGYRHLQGREDLAAMFVAITHIIIFTAAGSILSYMLTAHGTDQMWDSRLAQWDAAIGFDWYSYANLIDSMPHIASLYGLAYASLIPQIVILICALGFSGQIRSMRVAMVAAMTCGLLTIILSALMPALGNLAHFNIVPESFSHIDMRAGFVHIEPVTELRNGTLRTIDLVAAEGIITFPSYHAGLAMVTLWGFCRIPYIRLIGVPLAALTIAATPVNGCHYLVDVMAGVAIAIVSIFAAQRSVQIDTTLFSRAPNRTGLALLHHSPTPAER